MRRRLVFLPMLLAAVAGALDVACSGGNGDAIPSEVRDAEALDASGPNVIGRDSSSNPEDDGGPPNPPKDGGAKDADGAPDAAPSSADVRINEIYVSQSGGDQAELVELRGAEGTLLDDLRLRAIDDEGATTGEWPLAPLGTKIGNTGTWTLGGGTALGRIDKTVPAFDDWGLDNSKGAVLLLRGAGKTVIDAVSWNTDADGGTVMGEGKPYLLPKSGTSSFGRKPPSFGDTNDNQNDFCAMDQSAGATNTACK